MAEMGLLADFMANRISAHGVSHVVKAPSVYRRTIWGIIILATLAAMTVMTYRVLKEYLEYPTIMRSMAISVEELEFPAVTLCALSPIPKVFARESDLYYIEEMESLLRNLPKYSISQDEKTRCLKDPLCYWSWFDDVCHCHSNPCSTLYCYPDADSLDHKCACSKLMCQWNGTADACSLEADGTGTRMCVCRTDFKYPLANMEGLNKRSVCNEESLDEECDMFKPEPLPKEYEDALKALNTTDQIKYLLEKLKTSKTRDLRDVERFYLPDVNIMDDYGFPADSFILSCSFGIENCWHLVTLYTATYGKCYMFNYVGKEVIKKEAVRKVSQSGKLYGLQLFMRSRKNDSLSLLTRQLGVRLIIHDPRSIPVTSQEGIDIRPGDMTTIAMGLSETNRLGPPWGECAFDGQQLGNYSGDPYRQNDCERECINLEVFYRCKCYHPRFIGATTIPRRGNMCQTNASTASFTDDCFKQIMNENDKGSIKCNCPPPCRQKSYTLSMSTSKLNEEFFELTKVAKSLTMVNGTPAVTHENFESSLMGVQIYYNSLFVESINETAIYSWESLVANIGGNMGLFLGLSLVTVMEIVEFFVDLIYIAVAKRKSRAIKVKDTAETLRKDTTDYYYTY